MPDWMSQERMDLIRSLGAEIRLVSREEGGFLGSIRLAEELARPDARALPAPPVLQRGQRRRPTPRPPAPRSGGSSSFRGLRPDAFVAGVGTGGTIMGVGRFLQAAASRRSSSIPWSRPTRRRCPPATRSASTASRASPTSSSRPSSSWTSSTRSSPSTTATPS